MRIIETSRQEYNPRDNPNTKNIISRSLRHSIEESQSYYALVMNNLSDDLVEAFTSKVLSHMKNLKLPYHNDQHVLAVMKHCKVLGVSARLGEVNQHLLQLAALFHDFGHSGNTYRQLVPDAPDNDLSNEEYAALMADRFLGSQLFIPQRVALQGLILATSFGQNNPDRIPEEIRLDAFRPYRPFTSMEKILAFADIAESLESPAVFFAESEKVSAEEGIITVKCNDKKFLEGRLQFLGYVEKLLSGIQPLINKTTYSDNENKISLIKEDIEKLL